MCLFGVVYFSGRRCLVCICLSFSVFFGPSVLTDSGSGSDSLRVASSGHCEHFRFRSRAFSTHSAGLHSTHFVFLRSLLVGVFLWSCWHWFRLCRCLSRHASCTTLSKTRTLSLTNFGNTHIDTNRHLAKMLFPFMHSSIISSFLALAHIRRRFHFSSTRTSHIVASCTLLIQFLASPFSAHLATSICCTSSIRFLAHHRQH